MIDPPHDNSGASLEKLCGSCPQSGLGCWLVDNQSAADAAHIKRAAELEVGREVSRGAVLRSAEYGVLSK